MKAKLLKILRRDAERAVKLNEVEADGSVWVTIHKCDKYLDRCQGSSTAKKEIMERACQIAEHYRRAYILEKLKQEWILRKNRKTPHAEREKH